ncbi:MAG TPA: molybdopterin converting factor subunit 1 [Steroidobacteraceae bacterium]|nr:molybdopterin converting factor subunit 1 [Steroidobacteraceae bacterium]
MSTIEVRYYAVLREQAGVSQERVVTGATTAAALYEELRARHGLTLGRAQLRVAIDGEFADWQAPLADGSMVVFIPPVAGG